MNPKMNINDIVGKYFRELKVIEYSNKSQNINTKGRMVTKHYYRCECNCGNKNYIAERQGLLHGTVRSCGCLSKKKNHGESKTRLYRVWTNMKDRCYNERNDEYTRYGGRGIRVCEEWVHNYRSFRDWSKSNGYNNKLTIDRIDNNKGYSPDNCKWATYEVQANNTSRNHLIEYKGETKTLSEWSKFLKISYTTLRKRFNDGWDTERAFTEKINIPKRNYHESILFIDNNIYLNTSYGILEGKLFSQYCKLNKSTIGKYFNYGYTADETLAHYSKTKNISIEDIVKNCKTLAQIPIDITSSS